MGTTVLLQSTYAEEAARNHWRLDHARRIRLSIFLLAFRHFIPLESHCPVETASQICLCAYVAKSLVVYHVNDLTLFEITVTSTYWIIFTGDTTDFGDSLIRDKSGSSHCSFASMCESRKVRTYPVATEDP